ncbi:hypothetical protein SH2C18_48720 [Clostridium sediminicola]|uniref:ABC transporter permease n=1 Tax=Clostridium sediminicola TaxID=3114879 RepID=UPI0031F21315
MNSIVIGLNTIKRLLKEISTITFIIILPIMAAFITDIVYKGNINLSIAVSDNGNYDGEFLEFMKDTGKYEINMIEDIELEKSIKNKDFNIGIAFPNGFIEDINSEKINKISIISDKNDSSVKEIGGLIDDYYGMIIKGIPTDEYKTNLVNSNKYIKPQISLGLITMFILMFTGTGIGMLLEDKKAKTFMRIYSTPIRRRDMVFGHLLANFLLGSLQILIFMFVNTTILKFQWGISFINIYLLLLLFLIVSIGISISLVHFTSDNQKHNIMIIIIGVVTSLISGVMIPGIELGGLLGKTAKFTPQYWLAKIYNTLNSGGSFFDAKLDVGILLVFGITLFIFGVNTLTPNEEDL